MDCYLLYSDTGYKNTTILKKEYQELPAGLTVVVQPSTKSSENKSKQNEIDFTNSDIKFDINDLSENTSGVYTDNSINSNVSKKDLMDFSLLFCLWHPRRNV